MLSPEQRYELPKIGGVLYPMHGHIGQKQAIHAWRKCSGGEGAVNMVSGLKGSTYELGEIFLLGLET
jgi:hypothetical protein